MFYIYIMLMIIHNLNIVSMKKILLFLAFSALVAVSCKEDTPTDVKGSLSVDPSSLIFMPTKSPNQTFAVTADKVEWKVVVGADAASWLSAVKNEGTVVVSVNDNDGETTRTGTVTVQATTGTADPKSVTVTQYSESTLPEFSISVTPATLTFVGEGAEAQELAVVTKGDGLAWTAAADSKCESWVTLAPHDGKLVVSVSNNPTTEERSGMVMVTPNISTVTPKAIRITQAGKVLAPEFSVSPTDDLSFNYKIGETKVINVAAVNVTWTAKRESMAGASIAWLRVVKDATSVKVSVEANTEATPRSGYVVITPDNTSFEPVRILVTQIGKPDFLSTLIENAEITDMNGMVANEVTAYTKWEAPDVNYSVWYINLWGDDVKFKSVYPIKFTGTGTRLYLSLYSDKLEMIDEPDPKYYIPDGEYPIMPKKEDNHGTAGTVGVGVDSGVDYPEGSWYQSYANDAYAVGGPFKSGTVTVSRSGDTYTFVLDVVDDGGYRITGTFQSKLDKLTLIENRP